MQRIKKGDLVQVITGNEIGARGEVERVIHAWEVNGNRQRVKRDPGADRIVVKGVNIRKKHRKQPPTGAARTQTGIIELEIPINISNVMLVCPNCDEAVRVRFELEADKKIRVCKRCGGNIDKVS